MKRAFPIIISILIALSLASCSKSSDGKSTSSVEKVMQTGASFSTGTTEKYGIYEPKTHSAMVPDIDFTTISGPLVYSLAFNMIKDPDRFEGKVVKMAGAFDTTVNEKTGERFFACMVRDAGACCAQGIEFRMKGDLKYPEDYPTTWQDVTVIGVFRTYTGKDGMIYCIIDEAEYV